MDEPDNMRERVEIDKASKINKTDMANKVTFNHVFQEALYDLEIYCINEVIFSESKLLPTQILDSNNVVPAIKTLMIANFLTLVGSSTTAILNLVQGKFTGSLLDLNLPMDQINARNERVRIYQIIFIKTYKPERYTIKNIRKQMEYFRDIKHVDFMSLLNNAGIVDHYANFIEIKNAVVTYYAEYIDVTTSQLAELQKSVPNITIDVLDEFINQLAKFKQSNAQLLQERRLLGLMRVYAKYPQHRQRLLPLIIQNSKPHPILVGDRIVNQGDNYYTVPQFSGETKRVCLSDIARQLKSEGLLPSYISDNLNNNVNNTSNAGVKDAVKSIHATLLCTETQLKSFDETIEMFLKADTILGEFSELSNSYQYENIADKESAISKAHNILSNAKKIEDYNAAFNLMAPYINRHKHCKWDSFFGNDITSTWNKMMKQIREPALSALLNELNDILDIDDKITMLKKACEMPLFNQHRNNHWYTGAFGDTHAVSVIKKEIVRLENQKEESMRDRAKLSLPLL